MIALFFEEEGICFSRFVIDHLALEILRRFGLWYTNEFRFR